MMKINFLIILLSLSLISAYRFDHKKHQSENNCYVCHQPQADPSLEFKAGDKRHITKEWAHQVCIGCHELDKGPITCNACHI